MVIYGAILYENICNRSLYILYLRSIFDANICNNWGILSAYPNREHAERMPEEKTGNRTGRGRRRLTAPMLSCRKSMGYLYHSGARGETSSSSCSTLKVTGRSPSLQLTMAVLSSATHVPSLSKMRGAPQESANT